MHRLRISGAVLINNLTLQKLEKTKVQYITTKRTLKQLKQDLEKTSNQRENAAKDGLLRPFLYLVALSPVARLQAAINLGYCCWIS